MSKVEEQAVESTGESGNNKTELKADQKFGLARNARVIVICSGATFQIDCSNSMASANNFGHLQISIRKISPKTPNYILLSVSNLSKED